MVLITRDWSLGLLALLAAAALWVGRAGRHRVASGAMLATAGTLAGVWAATNQFLGSAYHVPRLPVVLLGALPPLVLGGHRLLRAAGRPSPMDESRTVS